MGSHFLNLFRKGESFRGNRGWLLPKVGRSKSEQLRNRSRSMCSGQVWIWTFKSGREAEAVGEVGVVVAGPNRCRTRRRNDRRRFGRLTISLPRERIMQKREPARSPVTSG